MEAILIPAIVLGLTGLAMGLFLAFASIKFEVQVDPKIEAISGILPGANCGGCGFPGCSGYAAAIVEQGAPMSLCAPGGAAVAAKIGEIMGASVDVSSEKVVARVLCQGDNTRTTKIYEFDGELQTCAAMMLYAGGDKSCVYSCLGHGDCEKVCPVGAIKVNEKGIAEVDEEKCISCGLCQKACPKKVIAMLPQSKKVTVTCSSKDKGATAKKACSTACIGCGICAKNCPVGAITVENNLAKIDPAKCISCGICALKCPTKAIVSDIKEIKKAEIIEENCKGCTACARKCPVQAIEGAVKEKHHVITEKCVGCGICFDTCKFKAIKMNVVETLK
ncbi:RnfABCDGE type electron transport complex subunit B [uncultured Fusobacterium sp.]|uniref:RnfABCDGE type electron transport complex subunit B n=1 Tax=uncultured Fusobacterium sp. TaxID=159267 RepID=UPI0025E7EC25|nr:RnfABCDGE type electron transport complex subunit B [uncultured Fusobacterium sp.]